MCPHRYKDFPENGILTKAEEKILRKIRRKIRNKKSAQCSRQRKKEYVEELEKKYNKCISENVNLKKEVMKLRRENTSLSTRIKNMLADGTAGDCSSDQASFKTSFFVLCLSFILIILPFMA
jgi:cyclic AMP-responsive element-binding protein 3